MSVKAAAHHRVNPKERPKRKPPAVSEIIDNVLNATAEYRERGQMKMAMRRELSIRTYINRALKGDVKSAETLFEMRAHAQKHGDAGIQRIVFKNWLPDHPGPTGDQKTTEFPGVFERLEQLARLCGARHGALGAFIEDKNSGTILLQQAARRNWTAHPIGRLKARTTPTWGGVTRRFSSTCCTAKVSRSRICDPCSQIRPASSASNPTRKACASGSGGTPARAPRRFGRRGSA
jgi:hypothetical protein